MYRDGCGSKQGGGQGELAKQFVFHRLTLLVGLVCLTVPSVRVSIGRTLVYLWKNNGNPFIFLQLGILRGDEARRSIYMNQNYLIAVVDDDQHIRNLVEAYLRKEGYKTVGLGTAEGGLGDVETNPPDMWVLDIMLPGMDGFELCRRIRAEAEVLIIMISAKDSRVDKILGLELGSDDYMVKPFSPRELVARIKRQLNRWYKFHHEERVPRLAAASRSSATDAFS